MFRWVGAVPTPKEWCSVYSDQICAYIWVINNSGRQLSPAMHANFEVRLPVEITSGFQRGYFTQSAVSPWFCSNGKKCLQADSVSSAVPCLGGGKVPPKSVSRFWPRATRILKVPVRPSKSRRARYKIDTRGQSSMTEGGYMAKPWAALPVSGSVILGS